MSESEKIWNEIKDLPVNIFGLPTKKVSDYATKLDVPAEQLYVKVAVGAALPAIEEAVGNKFEVEMAQQYTVIRRKLDLA